jgi:phage I-like protein
MNAKLEATTSQMAALMNNTSKGTRPEASISAVIAADVSAAARLGVVDLEVSLIASNST